MQTSHLNPAPIDRRGFTSLHQDDIALLEERKIVGAQRGKLLREFLILFRSNPQIPKHIVKQAFGAAITHCFQEEETTTKEKN